MTSLSKQFQDELNNCGKMSIIEEQCPIGGGWYNWDIYITNNGWLGAIGDEDFAVRLDSAFSLDEHLQAISEKISNYVMDNYKD